VELQSPASVTLLLGLLVGIMLGSVCTWFFLKNQVQVTRDLRNEDRLELERVTERAKGITGLEAKIEALEKGRDGLNRDLVEATTDLRNERTQSAEKLALLGEAKKQLSDQFESLARGILLETTDHFATQSRANLGQILEPLSTKLADFKKTVEDVYVQEGKDRSALTKEVGGLKELNRQLSEDAHNLATALKGSSKTQGDWGEVVLEGVLERSGLRKGHEYELRESYQRDDGGRAQPDVVIHLPEDRHLVVDSKVSLTAYTDYTSAETDQARDEALGRHVDSVRRHIKGLSGKDYQLLYSLRSLDFVVMFVPVEPAFMLALGQDAKLCEDACKKNVLLVSPSTFLFVVRTVAYLWRQEQQNRNVQEIAKKGTDLYDKLVGFVGDLTEVGERLKQATASYESARSKLSQGKGNVIRQAEMLKELGVRTSKRLPAELVELAFDGEPLALSALAADENIEGVQEEPGSQPAKTGSDGDIQW
jgi:DNA recombination protein RmuC